MPLNDGNVNGSMESDRIQFPTKVAVRETVTTNIFGRQSLLENAICGFKKVTLRSFVHLLLVCYRTVEWKKEILSQFLSFFHELRRFSRERGN